MKATKKQDQIFKSELKKRFGTIKCAKEKARAAYEKFEKEEEKWNGKSKRAKGYTLPPSVTMFHIQLNKRDVLYYARKGKLFHAPDGTGYYVRTYSGAGNAVDYKIR